MSAVGDSLVDGDNLSVPWESPTSVQGHMEERVEGNPTAQEPGMHFLPI